jgi:hypothetical protein
MIEISLTLAEARWVLQSSGITPRMPSPILEPVEAVPEIPPSSPAETGLVQALQARGLAGPGGAPNPFLSAALEWLSVPDRVWSLSLFGRGGAEMVHLALKEDAAVECRRSADGFRLRFPVPASEAEEWLSLRLRGGAHGA